MRAVHVGLMALLLAACGSTQNEPLPGRGDAQVPDLGFRRDSGEMRRDTGAHDSGVREETDARVDAGRRDAEQRDAEQRDAPAHDAGAGDRDAEAPETGAPDTGMSDSGVRDAGTIDAANPDASAPDAAQRDAGPPDAAPADTGPTYNCGAFTTAPSWTILTGYHAVVIADAQDGLNQPVALTFAGGAYGGRLYVASQGNNVVHAIDVSTGVTTPFTQGAAWARAPRLITSILWDETHAFDGRLYVGDQGSDSDQDSVIFRVTATGTTTVFAAAPGPGLDDIYGLALSPGGSYPAGLYVSGDTDGARVDWGLFGATGTGTPFSEVAGIEGMAVDRAGLYGGGLFASRPLGGGYSGDGTITRIRPDGTGETPLAANLGGIHAVIVAPNGAGAFGSAMLAARWDNGQLLRIDPSGNVTTLASQLSLTNYDGNILTFSPDGNVVYVADRQANRVVCIEPVP